MANSIYKLSLGFLGTPVLQSDRSVTEKGICIEYFYFCTHFSECDSGLQTLQADCCTYKRGVRGQWRHIAILVPLVLLLAVYFSKRGHFYQNFCSISNF